MKKILFLGGMCLVLTTIGCIVPEGGRYEHEGHERREVRSEVIVGPPVIVARPPEIIVH
jgi:hypothetical protein